MADPFSIVTGTIGLIDVCTRLVGYLRDLNSSAKVIEQALTLLIKETESLKSVNLLIQELWQKHGQNLNPQDASDSPLMRQWEQVGLSLQTYTVSMEAFDKTVREVTGNGGEKVKGKTDGLMKTLRKQAKDKLLQDHRMQVMSHRDNLQLLLHLLNFYHSQRAQASLGRSISDVSDEVRTLGFKLQQQMDILVSKTERADSESLEMSLATASRAVSATALNKHFYIPRAVNSLFIGRQTKLDDLRKAVFVGETSFQRRFVVCGMGGSGKTEFCCKFAQDNRNKFWGVFCVDGRSEQSLRQGFAGIAKIANLGEETGLAGRNWLANLRLPWLLIIDNADDPNLDLRKHFPAGAGGLLLITTRFFDVQIQGTVAPYFFDFSRDALDETESSELLLRAAQEQSRVETVWNAATVIARRLGYLPLALIQAGRAISRRVLQCTLSNYLEKYDSSWQHIRNTIGQDGRHSKLADDGIVNMEVYSSFAVSFGGLEHIGTVAAQDAVHVLRLFSFLSGGNIRCDLLTTAVTHVKAQRDQDEKDAAERVARRDSSWKTQLRHAVIWLISKSDQSAPTLPPILRESHFTDRRLSNALYQLRALALVSYNQDDDSYSMHPLVHTYIREQPELRIAEQALWCEVASSVLAQSILLPPLDTLPSADSLRRHLLSHVIRVQELKQEMNLRLENKRKTRRRPWRALGPIFTRQQAIEIVKFSWIYFSNGMMEEAKVLQTQVMEYVQRRLGDDNEVTWRIKMFLSLTYFILTEFNKAGELQASVVGSCERTLGTDHIQTLKYMTNLGATRVFQTRLRESQKILERAVSGLTKAVGESADETLEAKHYLGRTLRYYFDVNGCHRLYAAAFKGLSVSKAYGPSHPRTLEAKEDLATSYLELDNPDLVTAHRLIHEVKQERKRKLGTEHPLTLLARCSLARVKSGMRNHVKAESMIRKHLPVAERNLGERHLGTLMGHTYLALVVSRQHRYEEAEKEFLYVTDRSRYASSAREDGEHGDRIMALRLFAEMYIEWGKFAKALSVCDEIYSSTSKLGGEGLGLDHPIMKYLENARMIIAQKRRAH